MAEQQMKAAFDLFDRNNDGLVTIEELRAVLESLGQNNSALELLTMIQMVDSDGDGAISYEEFSKLMEQKPDGIDSDEEIIGAFRMIDKDKDGFISEGELRHFMCKLGSNLSGDEVKEMMQEGDTDGDGRLSYEEFKQIMHRI